MGALVLEVACRSAPRARAAPDGCFQRRSQSSSSGRAKDHLAEPKFHLLSAAEPKFILLGSPSGIWLSVQQSDASRQRCALRKAVSLSIALFPHLIDKWSHRHKAGSDC